MAVIHFAPLQGYTDSVYREAHTRVFGGVDTYYTPFVRIEKGGFRNKDLKDIACDRNRQVHVVPLPHQTSFGGSCVYSKRMGTGKRILI